MQRQPKKTSRKPGRDFLPDVDDEMDLSADQLVQLQFSPRQRCTVRPQTGTRVLWVDDEGSPQAKVGQADDEAD